MAATAPVLTDTAPATPPPLAVVPDDTADALQLDAEHSLWRDAIIGMSIGAVVCAGIWALLVLISIAGTDWQLGPAMWMGAAVGVFAGAFYGGVAGTMIGARKLEHAEHATLRH